MSIVSVKNLSFAYDKDRVLEDVSFDVNDKELVAIIGPNGGGKSTLLKLILGLLEPKSGEIKVFGKDPKEVRKEVGYVPQNTNVNLEFPITTLDVVMMGNDNKHNKNRTFFQKLFPIRYSSFEVSCAKSTLQRVGMQDYINRRIGALSGGQRQRVMIARALCTHPKLIILDEPTSSIDIDGQKQIYELLKKLSQDITVIVVSHDLSVITEYAKRVIYVNKSSYIHDLSNNPISLNRPEGHFCEVELMQMLGAKR